MLDKERSLIISSWIKEPMLAATVKTRPTRQAKLSRKFNLPGQTIGNERVKRNRFYT